MSYQWNANLYQQKHAFVAEYGSSLIEWLAPQPHEHILDLGCGTGELTEQIRQSGAEVIGVDRSAEMIHQAKRQYPHVSFFVMDAAQLSDLPQFEAIFSNAALHWMLEAGRVVQQMYKHLKPGGRLVVELGGKGNIRQVISAVNQQRIRDEYPPIDISQQWFFPSIGEYSTMLENAGFQVQLARHFPRKTPLQDAENGIADWIRMFGQTWLKDIPEHQHPAFLQSVQKILYPVLFEEGTWYADYQRLRIIAVKENT